MTATIKFDVMIGPELGSGVTCKGFQFLNTRYGQIFAVIPAQTRCNFILNIFLQVGGITGQYYRRPLGQFNQHGHVTGGVAR